MCLSIHWLVVYWMDDESPAEYNTASENTLQYWKLMFQSCLLSHRHTIYEKYSQNNLSLLMNKILSTQDTKENIFSKCHTFIHIWRKNLFDILEILKFTGAQMLPFCVAILWICRFNIFL